MGAEMENDGFLQQEYKQWQKAHAKMKDSPPTDGQDYIKHAKNLLALFEGVAELHPIAKAVVMSFKAVVVLEQDRRENDARVTAVFLAQTDVMRVLLDVDQITNRRRHRPDAEVLRSSFTLGEILLAIEQEIKSCGNSIYSYHKGSRFVKFWKAQDWKNRMLGHIDRFNKLRLELEQTLSVQIASGVEDIITKMNAVLSRLYAPKYDWERDLDIKTRGPQFSDLSWMENPDTLRALLLETNDPSLSIVPSAVSDATQDVSVALTSKMQLSTVKGEVQSSLDVICERNKDMFELILRFHTQQTEQAIINSANLVIQSLSGPSDRLVNEDLKQLWKEMDWIFCVENKFFVSALFEFYLDRFSSNQALHTFHNPVGETDNTALEEAREESLLRIFSSSVSAPKFSFLSRLGAISHPDAWTLEYIALHGNYITQAIDNDNSGYIRISEANLFTYQVPTGWTLPQWCAYSAAGWAYEARIYRRRICKMWTVLTELQPKVLPSNRTFAVSFMCMHFYMTYHGFIREPSVQGIPPQTPELRELVKQKVIAQDIVYRGHLQTLRWTIDDESTLHLLYGEMSPEKYILQFAALVLENFVAITKLCRTVTIDAKDWLRLSSVFRVIREISVKRILELQTRFENESGKFQNVATYYGGIWSFVKLHLDTVEDVPPYTAEELNDYLGDIPLLDDFPIPIDASPYLQYPTWQEFLKTVDDAQVFSQIPKTWCPIDDTVMSFLYDRPLMEGFPMTGWHCDRCDRTPAQEKRFTCLDINCPDFDLCQECYSLPRSEHNAVNHEFDHYAMLSTLYLVPDQKRRIAVELELVLEQLHQEINALKRSQLTTDAPDIVETGEMQSGDPEDTQVEKEGEDLSDVVEHSEIEDKVETGQGQFEPSSDKDTLAEEDDFGETKAKTGGRSLTADQPVPAVDSGTLQLEKTLETDMPAHGQPEGEISDIQDDKQLISRTSDSAIFPQAIFQPPLAKTFLCGRCTAVISLDNDLFRCVGHACQDYFVCSTCALERFEDDDETAHQWWHSLFVLRKDLLVDKPSGQPTEVGGVNNSQDVATLEIADAQTNVETTVNGRISKLEERLLLLDSTIHLSKSALETKLEEATSSLERLNAKMDDIGLETKSKEATSSLELKVERLEAKMDNMMTALIDLVGTLAPARISSNQVVLN